MNDPLKLLLQNTFTTPTIRSGSVMMKKKLMIQRKTNSPICLACATAKMLQCLLTNEIPLLHYTTNDDVLKRRFPKLLVTPSSLSASFGQDSFAEILKTKGENYYSLYCSLFTFTVYGTIHSEILSI